MSNNKRIAILGAGPTGLGAAYRLKELDYSDFTVYETEEHPGGLSSSFTDEAGFTWDLGGHVHFNHYPYYEKACQHVLGEDGFLKHKRKSYIFIKGQYIRYPFQNHLKDLPLELSLECLLGIAEANYKQAAAPLNFHQWIMNVFGGGITRLFMEPYNQKVWSHPLRNMSFSWLDERVSVIKLEEALKSILSSNNNDQWGPNNFFLYPKNWGTGILFNRFGEIIGKKLNPCKKAISVNPFEHAIKFSDGTDTVYDWLISTIPIDKLISIVKGTPKNVITAAKGLVHNSCIIVGVGLQREGPCARHWIYFPENKYPFYRVTHLSNYSPAVVPPRGGPYLSLLCEISFSSFHMLPKEGIEEKTIEGLKQAEIISKDELTNILSVSKKILTYAYPVPTLDRDERLRTLHHYLEPLKILSRGRFGAFRYEIGNMDHSFMQGVEAVDRILFDKQEDVFCNE